jgi:PAS domain S-box-containing protein
MNGNIRILVVDNEHTREFIGHILETKKYSLSTVSSGEDVLNLLHKNGEWSREHIDVLILDMAMSGISGFDLIKIIKSNPKTEDLRVILLGDREGGQAFVDALFGGASDYVVKPFVVAELIARIENQLKLKHADETRRELESRYQAIISMAEGVIVQDVFGRVLTTNPSAERILGTPQEQVMGRNFLFPAWHAIYEDGSVVHHDNYPTRVTLRTGQPLSNINMGMQKPGSEAGIGEDYWVSADITWISINTRPLIHPGEEKPYAVVVSFSDITESKLMRDALRESEEKFRALTESSPSAVFIIQGEKYVYINPTFEALIGFSAEEISEIKFWDLVHNDMAQTVMEHGLARQQDNQPIPRLEHKIIAKNGEIKWLDYIATRIIYQGQPALMGTAIDITERKQAEEALRESRTLIDVNIIAAGIAQQILTPIDLCAAATVRLHRRMQGISKAFASEELDRTYIQDCINTASESIAFLQTNLKRANELIESFTQMATYWINQEKRQFDLKDTIDDVK